MEHSNKEHDCCGGEKTNTGIKDLVCGMDERLHLKEVAAEILRITHAIGVNVSGLDRTKP